jgi:hypothetical protein
MNNLTKTLIAAVALSALATAANAQNSANDDAAVGITVLQPVSVTNTSGLQFGRVIRGAGDVAVDIDGARTIASGFSPAAAGTISAANFTVKAEGGQALTYTVPATVTLSNGASSLTVNTVSNAASLATATGSLGAEATYTLKVGGTVNVASNTATGAYTGTMNVIVAYQ